MKVHSSEPVYGIGIDTGGTYTDAVLYDLREHQVISASKRPTAHHNLELSIDQALEDIFPAHFEVGNALGAIMIALNGGCRCHSWLAS